MAVSLVFSQVRLTDCLRLRSFAGVKTAVCLDYLNLQLLFVAAHLATAVAEIYPDCWTSLIETNFDLFLAPAVSAAVRCAPPRDSAVTVARSQPGPLLGRLALPPG